MDCLVHNLSLPTPLILVYDPDFGSSRPRCSYCGSGPTNLSLVNPRDFLLHSMLHLPNVPAGTKQEQTYHVLGSICDCAPAIPLVAVGGEVQVWNSRGNGIFNCGVLASERRPACFHYGWRVPRNMEGFLVVGFQGSVASHQALSIIGGVMLCLELWYNTVLILLTGNMSNAEVAIDALSICLNINGWEMMISLGFLAAASVRVSNELGRGSSKAAKFAIVNTVLTSFFIGVVLFVLCLIFRGSIAYIFTENSEVVAAVESLSDLLAWSILLNSVQPVLSGVAIGAGWQSIVAFVNLGSYYLIGVPVGAVLGYVFDFQVKGVWIGMMFGTFVQTVVLLIITCKTDWDKQVSIAQERVNKWVVEPEPPSVHQENV